MELLWRYGLEADDDAVANSIQSRRGYVSREVEAGIKNEPDRSQTKQPGRHLAESLDRVCVGDGVMRSKVRVHLQTLHRCRETRDSPRSQLSHRRPNILDVWQSASGE